MQQQCEAGATCGFARGRGGLESASPAEFRSRASAGWSLLHRRCLRSQRALRRGRIPQTQPRLRPGWNLATLRHRGDAPPRFIAKLSFRPRSNSRRRDAQPWSIPSAGTATRAETSVRATAGGCASRRCLHSERQEETAAQFSRGLRPSERDAGETPPDKSRRAALTHRARLTARNYWLTNCRST